MSSFEKYRIHEVAKDLGTTSKVITEILTKYIAAPKTTCRSWRRRSWTSSLKA